MSLPCPATETQSKAEWYSSPKEQSGIVQNNDDAFPGRP